MIINATELCNLYSKKYGANSYSYTKIKNLLNGIKGNASKQEIKQLRHVLKVAVSETDNTLKSLENDWT